ncbi:hypothetical protein HMPREF7215_2173 [Pyramidobacter piscolens W5455]|uniref:Uncharacterized protein n=1 Tax=Pyramidobacter piscolens W5455 TaxID=352165 RepID=A0ABM9ZWT5_9BACT|nr:hypothetical protein HMPREF7215_2173 [Pyramidobacter piscolens W5455]
MHRFANKNTIFIQFSFFIRHFSVCFLKILTDMMNFLQIMA